MHLLQILRNEERIGSSIFPEILFEEIHPWPLVGLWYQCRFPKDNPSSWCLGLAESGFHSVVERCPVSHSFCAFLLHVSWLWVQPWKNDVCYMLLLSWPLTQQARILYVCHFINRKMAVPKPDTNHKDKIALNAMRSLLSFNCRIFCCINIGGAEELVVLLWLSGDI